jgi:glycerol transport system permease protein
MKARPWLFLLPALLVMSLSAFIPLLTVINYSLHYIFAGSLPEFVGLNNYAQVMKDESFRAAFWRQMGFSALVLGIEIPLGLGVALLLPRRGAGASFMLVLLGVPLLIPYVVVGIVWRLFTQSDIGPAAELLEGLGYDFNVSLRAIDAFMTLIVVDVWHWTPLVILLMYAGLQAIPPAFYRAAEIDGASAWQTFRHVTLPKLRPVMILAVLLRMMDSFKIYDEPVMLTGGGPGNATTFLSILVARKAESYELGYAGAASVIYLYLAILFSYLFFQFATHLGRPQPA